MKLIVGLGNPGDKYKNTRHNIGFEVIDLFAEKKGIDLFKNKFNGRIAEINMGGEKVILLKPMTYMNLSGNSVVEAVNFYKIDVEADLAVVYDDMDIDSGKIKIKKKGSPGGHNGVKSIISHIGQNFMRIKCGIGKPFQKEEVVNYVLGRFSKNEKDKIDDLKEKAFDCIDEFIDGVSLEKLMNKYNVK